MIRSRVVRVKQSFHKVKDKEIVRWCEGHDYDACPTCKDRNECTIVGKLRKYGRYMKEKVIFT